MKASARQSHQPAKPPWIKVRLPNGAGVDALRAINRRQRLHTVCESALCPNMAECWAMGHATFMIMGDGCTRNCAFCGVSNTPRPIDGNEPRHVAEAVRSMGLTHAVVTSVTRDDIRDGGAAHFADTLFHIRRTCPATTVEVLIPDFAGSRRSLETVVAAGPDILGHNMETVPRLYVTARPGATFERSLAVLKTAKEIAPAMITKSGIMVGLGETTGEVTDVIGRIRDAGVDILTIGQYLRPGPQHLPVVRYYHPDEFTHLKRKAIDLGFSWVESAPLVRSSYRAEQQARVLCRRVKR